MSDESKFIHDIGSPLSTIVILAATLTEELRERGAGFEEELEQMETINQLLEKVTQMMADRRAVIRGETK